MTGTDVRISLQSGKSVAIAEYGLPKGQPILFCHGWPSSRTMAQLTDLAARRYHPQRPC